MTHHFTDIHIAGIAGIVIKECQTLAERLPSVDSKHIERIANNTGIHSLSIANASTSISDLFFTAADCLLTTLQLDRHHIDAIIVVTQTPDYICPATSVLLQTRLKLSENVLAFDIHYGCSGYIYGLLQAALLLQHRCRNVLLCVGDIISPYLLENDHSTRALFSDGASATLLTRGNESITFLMRTDGSGQPYLYCPQITSRHNHPAYLTMDGMHVMRFVLEKIPNLIQHLLSTVNWSEDKLELLLLHQANALILEQLRRILRMPPEKIPIFLKTIGNVGGASIPVLLSGLTDKTFSLNRKHVIACGFGVGWSYGAAAFSLKNTVILPLLHY